MSTQAAAVAALALATFAIRAAGPVALGGRVLPARGVQALAVLPAAMLTALVVTQTFGRPDGLGVDARAAGLAIAAVATWRGTSMVVAVLAAATVTAVLRLL